MILSQLGAYINQQILFKKNLICSDSSLLYKKSFIRVLDCLKAEDLCNYKVENNRIFCTPSDKIRYIKFYKPFQHVLTKNNSAKVFKQLSTPFTKILCSSSEKGFFTYKKNEVGRVHACVYVNDL